jgi:argininosuccinate synthase
VEVSELKGKTVAMAVSGGLDSCTVTRWLADREVRVVCLTADLGQPDEENVEDIRGRMVACGAAEAVMVDAKAMIAEAGLEVLRAQARYEGGYWNTTGIARHVTVAALLPEALRRGIRVFGHGATGRGNDQVRFQLAPNMLAPEVEVYAPWRDPAFLSAFGGRKEMIDYCAAKGLPVRATHDKPYSTDANVLGLTHEAGLLESLGTPALFITPGMGVHPQQAPDANEPFRVRFEEGRPVAVNGRAVTPIEAFRIANETGGRNGVGIGLHTVENRFVGIKSRGVYEAPGMELLGTCYEYLLQLVLDRRARRVFQDASAFLAEQIYQGYWFDPASTAARETVRQFSRLATGTISVVLYKGNVSFESAEDAPHSLYSDRTASMEKIGSFDHTDSEGFCRVLGVSAKALHAAGQIGETLR